MNCAELNRWLDQGMPEAEARAARAHAAACGRCAAALRAATALEAMLLAPTIAAPDGFSERVMARVEAAGDAFLRPAEPRPSPLSWWVRAAAEPASALATGLAAVVLWQAEALREFALVVTVRLAGLASWVPGAGLLPLAAPFDRPAVLLALALAAMPGAAWCSWVVYRWGERLALARPARTRTLARSSPVARDPGVMRSGGSGR